MIWRQDQFLLFADITNAFMRPTAQFIVLKPTLLMLKMVPIFILTTNRHNTASRPCKCGHDDSTCFPFVRMKRRAIFSVTTFDGLINAIL